MGFNISGIAGAVNGMPTQVANIPETVNAKVNGNDNIFSMTVSDYTIEWF